MELSQFLRKIFLGKIFFLVQQKAAKKMCRECEEFIGQGSKILDIGCGRGVVTNYLKNYFEGEVVGVDIKDQRIVYGFPFQIFDGKTLPFKENFFDVAFISYVLHHTENQEELLFEAKRVTNGKIIIYEDLAEGFFGKLGNFIHRIISPLLFSLQNNTFNFKNEKSWEEIFQREKLKVIFKKRVKTLFNFLYPRKSVLFILKK